MKQKAHINLDYPYRTKSKPLREANHRLVSTLGVGFFLLVPVLFVSLIWSSLSPWLEQLTDKFFNGPPINGISIQGQEYNEKTKQLSATIIVDKNRGECRLVTRKAFYARKDGILRDAYAYLVSDDGSPDGRVRPAGVQNIGRYHLTNIPNDAVTWEMHMLHRCYAKLPFLTRAGPFPIVEDVE